MQRKIGLVLVVLNLIMALMATNYFLRIQKLSIIQWLAVNTCTPSIIIFVIGYFLKNMWLMGFSAVFLLFYGGCGLIVFRWSLNLQDLFPQTGHIFMTCAVIYIVYVAIVKHEIKKFFIGALIGLLVFIPLFYFQHRYQIENPELLKLLGFKDNYKPTE
ncbi:MAG: hypothetical protein AB1765_08025 [Candidatus Hydrogenedentota bacterium]